MSIPHSCVHFLQAAEICGVALSPSLTSVHFISVLIAFLFRLSANTLQREWGLYTLFFLLPLH